MMGNRTISSIALCLLVIPSVSPPVLSPAIVKGTFGDSVTLPCDGSAYVKSEDQLDVLWQTDGGKKVARFSRGVHSVGFHFTKRVTFLTEDIRRGNFSITISSIAFSDEGAYECVWRSQEEDEEVLNDVKLDVMEPPFSKFLSVPAGESVTLQCYVHVNKQASDEVVVQWKRGDEPVLNVSLGEVTNGRMYAERATVSPDRIQKGNFSLSLNITGLCDSGDYWCFTDKNQRGTPVTLKIEDYEHFHTVTLSLEMAFHLSLPGEPVKVNFSKEGTFPEVTLCSVNTDGFECDPKDRMEWNHTTLTILNVTSDDVGTYKVIRSKNCVISHAYKVNIKHSKIFQISFLVVGPYIIGLCIVCGIVYILMKRNKNKYSTHHQIFMQDRPPHQIHPKSLEEPKGNIEGPADFTFCS